MKHTHIIKKLLAVFLLVLFAFSITPKKSLHDLIANHKDSASLPFFNYAKSHHVQKDGFSCNCDQLVAESPFTNTTFLFIFDPLLCFIDEDKEEVLHVFSCSQSILKLRGPPISV